jgi:hypothetical protein
VDDHYNKETGDLKYSICDIMHEQMETNTNSTKDLQEPVSKPKFESWTHSEGYSGMLTEHHTDSSEQGIDFQIQDVGVNSSRKVSKLRTPSGIVDVVHMTSDGVISGKRHDYLASVVLPEIGFVWGTALKFSPRTKYLMKLFKHYNTDYLIRIVAKPALFAAQRVWVNLGFTASTQNVGFEWNPSEQNEVFVCVPWQQASLVATVSDVDDHMPKVWISNVTPVVYADGLATTIEYAVYICPLNMFLYTPVITPSIAPPPVETAPYLIVEDRQDPQNLKSPSACIIKSICVPASGGAQVGVNLNDGTGIEYFFDYNGYVDNNWFALPGAVLPQKPTFSFPTGSDVSPLFTCVTWSNGTAPVLILADQREIPKGESTLTIANPSFIVFNSINSNGGTNIRTSPLVNSSNNGNNSHGVQLSMSVFTAGGKTITLQSDVISNISIYNIQKEDDTIIQIGGSETVNKGRYFDEDDEIINLFKNDYVESQFVEQISEYKYNPKFSVDQKIYGKTGNHTARCDTHWDSLPTKTFNTSNDVKYITITPSDYGVAAQDLKRHLFASQYPIVKLTSTSVPSSNVLFRITQIEVGTTPTYEQILELPGIEWDPKTGPLKVQPYWRALNPIREIGNYIEQFLFDVRVLAGTIGTEPVIVSPFANYTPVSYHNPYYNQAGNTRSIPRFEFVEQMESGDQIGTASEVNELSKASESVSGPVRVTTIPNVSQMDSQVLYGKSDLAQAWRFVSAFSIDPTVSTYVLPINNIAFGGPGYSESTGYKFWQGCPRFKILTSESRANNMSMAITTLPVTLDYTKIDTEHIVSGRNVTHFNTMDGSCEVEAEWSSPFPRLDVVTDGITAAASSSNTQGWLVFATYPSSSPPKNLIQIYVDTSNVKFSIETGVRDEVWGPPDILPGYSKPTNLMAKLITPDEDVLRETMEVLAQMDLSRIPIRTFDDVIQAAVHRRNLIRAAKTAGVTVNASTNSFE